jgi:hypothetical protein
MTELSHQAQEVFWAFNRAASGKPDDWHYLPAIAAALRAAADQVVPEEIEPANAFEEEGYVPGRLREQRQETRRKLLAIAAELRGTTTTQENNND